METWMLGVEAEMRKTLLAIAKEGVFHYAKMARSQWILKQLGMMALVGSQIWWTWEVTDVFERVRAGNKLAMKAVRRVSSRTSSWSSPRWSAATSTRSTAKRSTSSSSSTCTRATS